MFNKILDPNFVHHQIWVTMKLIPGEDSKDITFEEPTVEILTDRTVWTSCGKTKVSEDIKYQPTPIEVCAYWTSVPDHLVVPQRGRKLFTFAMTVDKNQTVAKAEMIKGENVYLLEETLASIACLYEKYMYGKAFSNSITGERRRFVTEACA